MSTTPRVSVLMTVYNAAAFLERTLASLFSQTFVDFELIAVENGSADASRDILARSGDPRVKLFALPRNIGRTPALRYAFERASGEFVAVLDADDLNLPMRLEREVKFLDAHPDVVLIGSWSDFIDMQDRVVGHYRPPAGHDALVDVFGRENPIVHSSAMYRHADASAVGGYPAEFTHSQDLGLWLRLLGRGRVAVVEEVLCQFRVASGGMTQGRRHRVDAAHDQLRLLSTIRKSLPMSESARAGNREALAIARARYAWALAQQGQPFRAISQAAGALISDPAALLYNRVTRGFFGR